MTVRVAVPAAAIFLLMIPLAAQPSATRFAAASIKPSRPDSTVQDARLSFEGNRFQATSITIRDLLAVRYGSFSSGRVIGGPDWIGNARFDITATAEGPVAMNDRNAAVFALLEERFQLKTHQETKEQPGLALVVGRKAPPLERSEDGKQQKLQGGRSNLEFQHFPMWAFANYLTQILRTPVEDQTGLSGNFDFSMDPAKFAEKPNDLFPDLLRSAVEDLGFAFQSRKLKLEVTVIDHIERPSEN
jgi:uncharacterized protein (TIGR03435 family)